MDGPTPPKRNGCSRLFHCIMAVVYLVVLLTAVISLGTFATKQNEIASTTYPFLSRCVLFASYSGHINPDDGSPTIKLGQDAICVFSIWGEAALAFASLGMLIFAVVLASIGTKASSPWLVLIKLVLLTLCTLLALSVSSVITAGLSVTCKGFDDGANASPTESPVPCQGYFLKPHDGSESEQHFFYDQINTAKGAAWAGTILLIIVVTVYIVLLIWRACVRKPPRSTEMLEPLPESEEYLADDSDFKKV